MEYLYKAFISYRHAELDMKVATEIQNRLERYHIPASIRREKGIKSIGRIFRDKDELPSTSDLNDNIKNAIRSSEYLICICSPSYIESVWCRKELEFFLETHDKKHVLTVLADGDPMKVVPDLLLKETVTVKDADGNDVTIEAPLEPLSCDWRVDRHRARTEELPRLASVLIGCRYADLRQKMRKRRMRLTALASAFAAVLLAYFVWSYLGIQRNYRQSLINQSRYLASSAQKALDSNDNLLAAQLSLAALPDEKADRPIVPEALYTLSKAVGAYDSKEVLNFRGVASYAMPRGTMTQYAISTDAGHLAMTNLRGDLAIYDLLTDTLTTMVPSEELIGVNAYNLARAGAQYFVLWESYGHTAALIRYSDGAVVWKQKFVETLRNIIVPDGDGDAPLIALTEEEFVVIDKDSGDLLGRVEASRASDGQASIFYKQSDYYTENGGLAAVCPEKDCICLAAGNLAEEDASVNTITGFVTYNYRTGDAVWTPFSLAPYAASGLSRDAEGRILLTCTKTKENYAVNYLRGDSSGSSFEEFTPGKETLFLIEEKTGNVLWENALSYQSLRPDPAVYQALRVMPGDETHPDREFAVAATSNVIALYDLDSGSPVKTVTFSDRIVSVEPPLSGENLIRVNGYSGTQYYMTYFDTTYNAMQFMAEGMDDATFFKGKSTASGHTQFIVRQGNTIRLFKGGQGDEDWTPFDCTAPEGIIYEMLLCGDQMFILDSNANLYAYKLPEGTDLWQTKLTGDTIYFKLYGSSSDYKRVYVNTNEEEHSLFRISALDGTCELVSLIESDGFTGAGRWHFDTGNPIRTDRCLFFRATNYDTESSFWFRFSLDDESITHLKMPYYIDSDESTSISPYMFSSDGSRGVVIENGAGYLINFDRAAVTQCKDPFPAVSLGAFQDDGRGFAIWNEEERKTYVYASDGSVNFVIEDIPEEIGWLHFYEDHLYLATQTGSLYRYNLRDAARSGVIEMPFTMQSSASGLANANDGNMVINSGTGDLLMVDLDSWTATAEANNVLGYSADTRQIISQGNVNKSGDNETTLGACPYYSPQELIEKGRKFVGDHTLSEIEKTAYGLE